MPATVINGVFTDGIVNWQAGTLAGTYKGYLVVPNITNVSQTWNSAVIGGTNAGNFSVPGGQLPVTTLPGQSMILEVDFTPSAGGNRSGNITVSASGGYYQVYSLAGFGGGNAIGEPFPSILGFPATKIGQTTTFANVVIVNVSSGGITVTALALTTGTDFSIVGAPATPFVINAGAQSALFSIQFTPTLAGSRNDFLNVTTAAGTGVSTIYGFGSTLQSAFSLTGATQGTLFAFPGVGAPLVLLASPTNFNTEEPGSIVRIHDFGMVNVEKQLMRVRGHYEDLGPAVITIKARARRVGQPDEVISVNVNVGTAFADGWIREFASEPTPLPGELIQLTISRAGNSGPVSIIDFTPEFEPKGEVIGGT